MSSMEKLKYMSDPTLKLGNVTSSMVDQKTLKIWKLNLKRNYNWLLLQDGMKFWVLGVCMIIWYPIVNDTFFLFLQAKKRTKDKKYGVPTGPLQEPEILFKSQL